MLTSNQTIALTFVRFFNIEWDTDGEDVLLPKETTLNIENAKDLSLEGADVLSDKYGWCVISFDFEVCNQQG